jgi:hypothetical protein
MSASSISIEGEVYDAELEIPRQCSRQWLEKHFQLCLPHLTVYKVAMANTRLTHTQQIDGLTIQSVE